MRIEAKETIIEYDQGQMVILNPGDVGELSDTKAADHIEGGRAKPAGKEAAGRPGAKPAGKEAAGTETAPAEDAPTS